MKCLLCGGTTKHRFSQDRFDLQWCEQCDFGRLAGDFTPEIVSTFYSADYYTHQAQANGSAPLSLFDRALVHAAWRLDHGVDFSPSEIVRGGTTVCDIGCGNGNILRLFKQAGYATTGIDPDPLAREAASDIGTILHGTAEDHSVTGKFDVVVMSHVLEHCIDPIKSIDNAIRLMTRDGTLVIEVPNNAALGFDWFGTRWPWTDIPRHLSFFTNRSLGKLLMDAGLVITQTYFTGFNRQFSPSWRRQIGRVSSGWPLLAALALKKDSPQKYDSIRVHATLR